MIKNTLLVVQYFIISSTAATGKVFTKVAPAMVPKVSEPEEKDFFVESYENISSTLGQMGGLGYFVSLLAFVLGLVMGGILHSFVEGEKVGVKKIRTSTVVRPFDVRVESLRRIDGEVPSPVRRLPPRSNMSSIFPAAATRVLKPAAKSRSEAFMQTELRMDNMKVVQASVFFPPFYGLTPPRSSRDDLALFSPEQVMTPASVSKPFYYIFSNRVSSEAARSISYDSLATKKVNFSDDGQQHQPLQGDDHVLGQGDNKTNKPLLAHPKFTSKSSESTPFPKSIFKKNSKYRDPSRHRGERLTLDPKCEHCRRGSKEGAKKDPFPLRAIGHSTTSVDKKITLKVKPPSIDFKDDSKMSLPSHGCGRNIRLNLVKDSSNAQIVVYI